jgi:hypothetical protein
MHHDLDPERAFGKALRELPDEAARPYEFREFERRAQARARRAVRSVQALAAAVALIVVASAALYMRLAGPRNESAASLTGATPAVAAGEANPGARADAMENWLATLPSDPALVRVGTRAAVTGLEDRIAQVDDLLSAARAEQAPPARLSDLQQERLRLVGALVQVRYAETLADATR